MLPKRMLAGCISTFLGGQRPCHPQGKATVDLTVVRINIKVAKVAILVDSNTREATNKVEINRTTKTRNWRSSRRSSYQGCSESWKDVVWLCECAGSTFSWMYGPQYKTAHFCMLVSLYIVSNCWSIISHIYFALDIPLCWKSEPIDACSTIPQASIK